MEWIALRQWMGTVGVLFLCDRIGENKKETSYPLEQ